MLNEFLLLTFSITVAWLIFGRVLPDLGRAATLRALHARRALLYDVGEVCPSFRDTVTYRDIEYVLSWTIHVAQYGSVIDALRLFGSLRSNGASDEDPSLRQRVMLHELEQLSEQGFDAIVERLEPLMQLSMPLLPRVALGHPVLLLFVAVLLLVGILAGLTRSIFMKNGKPRRRVPSVEQIERPWRPLKGIRPLRVS